MTYRSANFPTGPIAPWEWATPFRTEGPVMADWFWFSTALREAQAQQLEAWRSYEAAQTSYNELLGTDPETRPFGAVETARNNWRLALARSQVTQAATVAAKKLLENCPKP